MKGQTLNALSSIRPVSGELPLVETGRPCDVTRDRCAVPANSPPTGAGTIGGRLRAIDVDGEMFLLQIGLELGVKVSMVRILVSIVQCP